MSAIGLFGAGLLLMSLQDRRLRSWPKWVSLVGAALLLADVIAHSGH